MEHTTIYRWVQHYALEMNKRLSPHLCKSTDSYRIDETYFKVKEDWKYLYRSIDSPDDTLHFIEPGKIAQNGYVERVNRVYREDILDLYLFRNLTEVRNISSEWCHDYNG